MEDSEENMHADIGAYSLPVAQWLERPTGARKVMGSIPVGDSDFFFVSRSRHSEYSIFC